jgi:hypothetical protein
MIILAQMRLHDLGQRLIVKLQVQFKLDDTVEKVDIFTYFGHSCGDLTLGWRLIYAMHIQKVPFSKRPTLKTSHFQSVPSLNVPRTIRPTAQNVGLFLWQIVVINPCEMLTTSHRS